MASSTNSSGTGGTTSDGDDSTTEVSQDPPEHEHEKEMKTGGGDGETETDVENSGPTNIDLVDHKLYLGNLAAACDIALLGKYHVSHILTIDSCPLPTKITHLPNVKTKFLQVSDIPREDVLQYFEETYVFIEQAVNDENTGSILIHCYFGVSRSATIVLAYLMRKYQISLEEAQHRLKARRSVIGPNFGFLAQLKLFEIMRFRIDKSNLFYRRFRLHVASDKVKSVKILPHPYNDVIKSDPSFLSVKPEPVVYQCKKCRRILASASNLLTHNERKSPLWFDFQSEDDCSTPICSQMHFIEPLAWMVTVPQNLQGKLYCPNQICKSKLGSFSWIMGCLCPCGAKVQPAFYLVPSKVDRSTSVRNIQITL